MDDLRRRLRSAWQGRISGCQLGKPVEILVHLEGQEGLDRYLQKAGAVPLRDYIPLIEDTVPANLGRASCKGHLERSEPDDDINYTVLALLMLEEKGLALETADVGRAWLRFVPAGWTFTAAREAYMIILDRAHPHYSFGLAPGFDLEECSDHEWNEWIGAQIRADLYGWVCPGRPDRAADLARRDAALSHRGEGIHGAVFVAALGAAIPGCDDVQQAVEIARRQIPEESRCAEAIELGLRCASHADGGSRIRETYADLHVVHTVNNLALVVWALARHADDFSAAVGDVVAAGLDTDCNGATVGGLWGLQGKAIPDAWTKPWQGRVAVGLAGLGELSLEDLVERSAALAERFASR